MQYDIFLVPRQWFDIIEKPIYKIIGTSGLSAYLAQLKDINKWCDVHLFNMMC